MILALLKTGSLLGFQLIRLQFAPGRDIHDLPGVRASARAAKTTILVLLNFLQPDDHRARPSFYLENESTSFHFLPSIRE